MEKKQEKLVKQNTPPFFKIPVKFKSQFRFNQFIDEKNRFDFGSLFLLSRKS